MDRVLSRRAAAAVVCGVAGLAVNTLPSGAVLPLLLGRTLSLPIAIFFGPVFGAIAAAVSTLPAVSQLGPAPAVFAPLEAIVIGFTARRGRSPLIAGTLLWSLIGLTLVVAPQFYGVGYLRETVWPVALALVLIRLVAIVLADFIAVAAIAQNLVPGVTRFEQ